jgi:hypothetical protein
MYSNAFVFRYVIHTVSHARAINIVVLSWTGSINIQAKREIARLSDGVKHICNLQVRNRA